jgi:hypothetical protein
MAGTRKARVLPVPVEIAACQENSDDLRLDGLEVGEVAFGKGFLEAFADGEIGKVWRVRESDMNAGRMEKKSTRDERGLSLVLD